MSSMKICLISFGWRNVYSGCSASSVCLFCSSAFRRRVEVCRKSQSHFVSRSPSPSSTSSWDWGRAPGLVLGGIWLAQDSVSSLHSLTSHTQSSHRVSPQLSLCWPLIGRPPPTLASDWSLASPGLDSGPSLHWSLAARCTAGHPGNFYLHQKCFNSSNKLHSKLVLIRICPVMPFERVTLIWFVPATQLLLDLYLLNIT